MRERRAVGQDSGIAKAAARVTMPRMPAQETTQAAADPGPAAGAAGVEGRAAPTHRARCRPSPRRSAPRWSRPAPAPPRQRIRLRASAAQPLQIGRNCMPISTKAKAFEHEDHGLPDREDRHPHARRHREPPRAGDGHREGHQRQDARQADRLGRDPNAEGDGELHDRRRSARRAAVVSERHHEPSATPATRLPKADEQEDRRDVATPSGPGHRGHDRQPVDEQRAGVVQQALAFEDLQQLVRQLRAGASPRSRRPRPAARRWRRARSRPARACPAPASAPRGDRHAPSCRRRPRPGRRPAPVAPQVAQRGV